MDRGDLQTRRRNLDRRLLALADAYQRLGDLVVAATNAEYLNPFGLVTDALFGLARDLRAAARRWAPESRGFSAVFLVVRRADGAVLSAWPSRRSAQQEMLRLGAREPHYGLDAHALGHPGVDVDLHELADRLLRSELDATSGGSPRHPRLGGEDVDALLRLSLLGKVEVIDGRLLAGGRWELVFGPDAERAAADAGVAVPGCLEAVLADPELRDRARAALCRPRDRSAREDGGDA
jgi:hypothetical protein